MRYFSYITNINGNFYFLHIFSSSFPSHSLTVDRHGLYIMMYHFKVLHEFYRVKYVFFPDFYFGTLITYGQGYSICLVDVWFCQATFPKLSSLCTVSFLVYLVCIQTIQFKAK